MQEPVNLKVEDSEIHTFKCQVRIKAIETGPKPFQEFELLHGAGQW
jgi:hypothetical protein